MSGTAREYKRGLSSSSVVTTRSAQAPVAMDPHRFDVVSERDWEAMMVKGEASSSALGREEADAKSSDEELIPEQAGEADALVLESWMGVRRPGDT